MSRIKTSYFWKVGNQKLPNAISISQGNARVKIAGSIKALAPSWAMINLPTEDEYIRAFKAQLSKLDPQQILREIEEIGQGETVYLCCFENSFDFCHRHLVAEWLEDNLNIEIEEHDQEGRKRENYRYTKSTIKKVTKGLF